MPVIVILSEKDAIELVPKLPRSTFGIISITGAFDDNIDFKLTNYNDKILNLHFDDVDGSAIDCMSYHDAVSVREFVDVNWERLATLIVHCHAGLSRSAGVAAAILKVKTGDDSSIFNNGRFRPNSNCYSLTLKAFELRPKSGKIAIF